MKRPLAYLTAAWSGEPDIDMELAAHYCRLAYEAGFSPKETMSFIDFFGNLAAHIGQMEKVIFVHCKKAAVPRDRHRMAHAGL